MKKYFTISLFTFCCIIFAMDDPNKDNITQIIFQFDRSKTQLEKLEKEYEQEKKALEKQEAEQKDPMDADYELETLEACQVEGKLKHMHDLDFQRAVLEEKKEGIEKLKKDLQDLDEVTADLLSLINDNDTQKIDGIEHHVISRGVQELRKAEEYNRKNKQCLLQ